MGNYLDPVPWKPIEEAGTDENLIEHVPVIVHVPTGIAIVCPRRPLVAVSKVSPS
jgi:hypothetical protein